MTLIDMMFGSFQTGQGAAITRMGAQSARKSDETGGSKSFVDILNNTMGNSDKGSAKKAGFYAGAYAGTVPKEANTTAVKSDNTPVIRSFREASKYNRKMDKITSKDSAGEEKDIEEVSRIQEKASDTDKASEPGSTVNMMQIAAQMLGLEVRELQKLLSEAGITPESFESLGNISEISSDLAQILGLNDNQQKTLEIMLQTAAELLGEFKVKDNEQRVPTHLTAAPENVQQDMTAAPARDIVESSMQMGTTIEQLSEQIKLKLDEYGIRLEEGEDSVQEDIKAFMLPLLEKPAPKIQQAAHPETQMPVEAPETKLHAAETEEMTEDRGSQEDEDSGQTEATVRLPQQADSQPAVSTAAQTQPVFSPIIQANQAIEAMPVTAAVPAAVSSEEIISQVIEKAQIIMMPDKSEMVMELKPDNLGKLSLKLVTENGIVMAKFVAENRQVKEVLESNMQLLKDSLQKQGLDVQGFSVSVRQDSNRFGRNNRQEGRTGVYAKEPVAAATAPEVKMPVFSEAAERRNPYLRETSTIELSA